jgi:predicted ATPase/DNA-binding winged helix-turn-helix (wHTH) protein
MAARVPGAIYVNGEWEVDLARRELRVRGAAVPLGRRAFEIVAALIQAAGQLVTKDDMMDRVWPGAIVGENALQVHISAVRKALGSDRAMLETRFGRGYRLLGDWQPRDAGAPGEPDERSAEFTRPRQPAQSNFPGTPGSLVGRAVSVVDVQTLLSAYRVVTLVGPGGIGKTSLALDVGRRLLPDLNGDVWLVELASLSDPGMVASVAASVLGLRIGSGEVTASTVAQAIGGTRMLLVLDNCEHVIDAAASLAESVVRLCPRAIVLATSRESLRIDGEHVYRVPPLDVPPERPEEPDDILSHSAVQLFTARMQAGDSQSSLAADDLTAIAAICRHLDGIPLAIELAAARAVTLGPRHVAARMHDRFKLLTAGRRTALARHQTLAAALDWSHDLLTDDERTTLRRLGVFAGDFTLEAAEAIVPDNGTAASAVAESLASLVAKSLAGVERVAAPARYRLLETTRAYAQGKLEAAGEQNTVSRRHATHFLDVLKSGAAAREPDGSPTPTRQTRLLVDEVSAALEWAFSPPGDRTPGDKTLGDKTLGDKTLGDKTPGDRAPGDKAPGDKAPGDKAPGDMTLGVNLTVAAIPLWMRSTLVAECRRRVEQAIDVLHGQSGGDGRGELQLMIALATAMQNGVGPGWETTRLWRRANELAEQSGDQDFRLRTLWGLWIDCRNAGKHREGLEMANRFHALATSRGEPSDMLVADRMVGMSLAILGDLGNARNHVERMLSRYEEVDRTAHMVRFHFEQRAGAESLLAWILWLQGFPGRARTIIDEVVAEVAANGHAMQICVLLAQFACPVAWLNGDLFRLERFIATLLDHAGRHGLAAWRARGECWRALGRIRQGDSTAGIAALDRALQGFPGHGRAFQHVWLLGELARAQADAGAGNDGRGAIELALERAGAGGELWCLAELLRIRGHVLQSLGESDAAEKSFAESLAVARRQLARAWELRAATSLSRLWCETGRQAAAVTLLHPLCREFVGEPETADLSEARGLLSTAS